MPRRPPFSEEAARQAVASSVCWRDALRKLGYRSDGGNPGTLKRWVARWDISTDHFDPHVGRRRASRSRMPSLEEVLVCGSAYPRGRLKERLYDAGLKDRLCEMCEQNETWRGRKMSLIIDHVNGVRDDNRLENLRIVCPNCAATLETHCGRNLPRERKCAACEKTFAPQDVRHRYCSLTCWGAVRKAPDFRGPGASHGVARLETRKVERPPREQLLAEIEATNYEAVGRRHGVSGNAIRKWVRFYEAEARRDQFQTEG